MDRKLIRRRDRVDGAVGLIGIRDMERRGLLMGVAGVAPSRVGVNRGKERCGTAPAQAAMHDVPPAPV